MLIPNDRHLTPSSIFRKGLTPSRPVRLSHDDPPSRPTSSPKAMKGQQRRSSVIHKYYLENRSIFGSNSDRLALASLRMRNQHGRGVFGQ
jgi:hypothetical protein